MSKRKSGFTLIELAVVIVIIGVLVVIALVEYADLAERARMSEAKEAIGAVRKAQWLYKQDNDRFTDDIADLEAAYLESNLPDTCDITHWFRYSIVPPAGACANPPCFQVNAARCTSGGKSPDTAVDKGYTVSLLEDSTGKQIRCLRYDANPDKCIVW